ncbi:hypothetical protein MLD38_025260 [Melastoma candidum]|uniref:Uncharacterized protein n=1 Tax=Melastoma candidum TaxID=119954 RepID=A0ACB9NUI9_9MYRT|nr:hypothetical protein MLD38_025260 [Melastoma candidum]
MGEKKNKGEGSNDDDNKKKNAGSGGGKGDGKKEDKKKEGMVVVLKMDMHCEGCANKILKYAKSIAGVEKAKVEWESNKLTVLGDVDPLEIREDLQEKTKKKVELISPQLPSKDKKEKAKDGGGKKADVEGGKKSQEKKAEEPKKPKEIPAITAVFKVELHCSGCIKKIKRIVSKTKGVESVAFDRDKDLVAVTGRFNAGELGGVLSERMKRSVQVIPPKKSNEDDGKGGGGGGGGGGEKKDEKKGSSKVAEEEDDDDYDDDDDDEDYDDYDDEEEEEDYGYAGFGGGGFMEGRRAEYGGAGAGGYGGYPAPMPIPPANYGLLYGHSLHAPQMFSDENPNACSIM